MVDDTSPFLEVFCEVSGKDYRFTTGTKAEFAVSVINRKLGSLKPRVIYIEAAKEGEEPISFGDNASLLNYGLGWKLKTVVDADLPGNLILVKLHYVALYLWFMYSNANLFSLMQERRKTIDNSGFLLYFRR
jgi:hypothetical protein